MCFFFLCFRRSKLHHVIWYYSDCWTGGPKSGCIEGTDSTLQSATYWWCMCLYLYLWICFQTFFCDIMHCNTKKIILKLFWKRRKKCSHLDFICNNQLFFLVYLLQTPSYTLIVLIYFSSHYVFENGVVN